MQQRASIRLLPSPRRRRPRPRQAKQNASAMANQSSGEASVHGQSTASLPTAAGGNSKLDNPGAGGGGGGRGGAGATGGSAAGAGGTGTGDDGVDAGIDLSEEAYGVGADEAGASMLCAWLNANVATTFIEVCRMAVSMSERVTVLNGGLPQFVLQRIRTPKRFKQASILGWF